MGTRLAHLRRVSTSSAAGHSTVKGTGDEVPLGVVTVNVVGPAGTSAGTEAMQVDCDGQVMGAR